MEWISFKKRSLFDFPPTPSARYLISYKRTYEGDDNCVCNEYGIESCNCKEPSVSDFCYDILYYEQYRDVRLWKSKTFGDHCFDGPWQDNVILCYWVQIMDPKEKL